MSKKFTLVALSLCLTAGPVFAGPMGGVVRVADAAEAQKAQPTGEHMSDAQKQNLEALAKELKAVKDASEVTDAQKESLANTMMKLADEAHKPSEESVNALVSSLSTAKSDGEIDPAEAMKLAKDIAVVVDSSGIPPEDAQAAAKEAQAILEASGVSKDTAKAVADDLMVIAAEVQKNVEAGAKNVEEATGGKAKKRRSKRN